MPFQSEKQRRYLHANHPEIANRWEAKYGLGGIAELNAQLNSLPEYFMNSIPAAQGGRIGFDSGTEIPEKFLEDLERKKYYKLLEEYRRWKENYERRKDLAPTQAVAHGGFIPSHEAGIYGLAEGGRTDYIHGGITYPSGRRGFPGGAGTPGGYDAPAPSSSGGDGYQSVHDTGAVTQTPGRTTVSTTAASEDIGAVDTIADLISTTDDKGGGYTDRIIDVAERKRREDLRNIVAQGEKTEKWEQAQKWEKPNKFLSFLGNAALAIIPGLLPAKMATAWKVGKLGWDITKTDRYDRYFELAGINKNEWLSKIGSVDDSKRDLYESLPAGHPEKIALQAELEIGKKTTSDGPDGEGGITQDTSIKIENIEEVNDDKTQLQQKYNEMDDASRLAWQRQQQMNRDKQMAYYRMMMKPYFTGAAKGGRVPAGYNTGGLSNLFRLKNV